MVHEGVADILYDIVGVAGAEMDDDGDAVFHPRLSRETRQLSPECAGAASPPLDSKTRGGTRPTAPRRYQGNIMS